MRTIAHIKNDKVENLSAWSETPNKAGYLDVTDFDPPVHVGDYYIDGKVLSKDAYTTLDALKDRYVRQITVHASQPAYVGDLAHLSALLALVPGDIYLTHGTEIRKHDAKELSGQLSEALHKQQDALAEAYEAIEKIKKAKTLKQLQALALSPLDDYWIHPDIK